MADIHAVLHEEPATKWDAEKRHLILTGEGMDRCGHWQAMMSDLREHGHHDVVVGMRD